MKPIDMKPIDEQVRARPAGELRSVVAGYTGYRQRNLAPGTHRGLPSPWLTLIFTIDEPLHLARHVDPSRPPASYTALLGGLHDTPVLIAHEGAQSGIQVALHPLGAHRLLGLPAAELVGTDLPADVVLGAVAQDVRERLSRAPSWAARFGVLDAILTRLLRDTPAPAPGVRHAWSLLLATRGRVSVRELALEVGWSEKHLANQLRHATGMTPKQVARIVRFDHARRRLQRHGPSGLARVAADCGYYDQAHMSREFGLLAGCSPARWWVVEFGNVQSRHAASSPDSPS